MSDHQPATRHSALTLVLRLLCLLPFITGAADLAGGTKLLIAGGARIPMPAAADPVLNNQIGFWGAIWFGYGLLLWWAAGDIRGRAVVLRILLATLFLSGLGRLLAVVQFGWASPPLTGAMVLELVGSIVLLAWHARAVGTRSAFRRPVLNRP